MRTKCDVLVTSVRTLRTAQRAYMTARAERGGKNRVYDDSLNVLGRAVAEAANDVDLALKDFE